MHKKRHLRVLIIAAVIGWVLALVPIAYEIKSGLGIDIFKKGGYHTFKRCMVKAVGEQ